MADQNRLPEEQRENVNENEDMTDGSSQGTAPAAGDGPAPGTYGPQGDTVQQDGTGDHSGNQ